VKPFSLAYAIWIGLPCTALAPLVKADMWDKRTVVTFHQPVEIPQHVLIPGTYVMKLVDLDSHRDIVQFLNKKENQVIATVFAIPAYEPNVVHDRTFFTYEERAANSPQAIKTWFYPGDPWGEEFIYGAAKPVANQAPPTNFTPRAAAIEQPRPAVQPAPAPVIAQNTAPARPEPAKPVEVSQATPAPAAKQQELPKTASMLPLIALLGGLSAASGLALKACRKLL
jgi:cell division septation protein DedD